MRLSRKQAVVVEMICKRLRLKQMAGRLNVKVGTVGATAARIARRLGVRKRKDIPGALEYSSWGRR